MLGCGARAPPFTPPMLTDATAAAPHTMGIDAGGDGAAATAAAIGGVVAAAMAGGVRPRPAAAGAVRSGGREDKRLSPGGRPPRHHTPFLLQLCTLRVVLCILGARAGVGRGAFATADAARGRNRAAHTATTAPAGATPPSAPSATRFTMAADTNSALTKATCHPPLVGAVVGGGPLWAGGPRRVEAHEAPAMAQLELTTAVRAVRVGVAVAAAVVRRSLAGGGAAAVAAAARFPAVVVVVARVEVAETAAVVTAAASTDDLLSGHCPPPHRPPSPPLPELPPLPQPPTPTATAAGRWTAAATREVWRRLLVAAGGPRRPWAWRRLVPGRARRSDCRRLAAAERADAAREVRPPPRAPPQLTWPPGQPPMGHHSRKRWPQGARRENGGMWRWGRVCGRQRAGRTLQGGGDKGPWRGCGRVDWGSVAGRRWMMPPRRSPCHRQAPSTDPARQRPRRAGCRTGSVPGEGGLLRWSGAGRQVARRGGPPVGYKGWRWHGRRWRRLGGGA